MGRRPYVGRDRKEIRDQILAKQVQIKKNEIPPGWSIEAADFINRLIQRKPVNRLGQDGPQEVKGHPWLKNFDWDRLISKQMDPPFLPNEDGLELRHNNTNFDDENSEIMKQNAILLRRNSIQGLFNGYNYDAGQPNMSAAGAFPVQLKGSFSNNIGSLNSFSNQSTLVVSASSPVEQR